MTMWRFIYKTIIFLTPVFLLLLAYVWLDVFKVVRDYDSYYTSGSVVGADLNTGHVAVMTYKQKHKLCNYDAFVFGNSRSECFQFADWQKYIGDDANCFHFDASHESLYGIWRKIHYINESGNQINNVLLVLDYEILSQLQSADEHIYIIHPDVEDYGNYFKYHLTFLKVFFDSDFLGVYLNYRLTGEIEQQEEKKMLNDKRYIYDCITNERLVAGVEDDISQGKYYTTELMRVFEDAQFPDSIYPQFLESQHIGMLQDIKDILDKHDANYRVIISPIYNQVKLNANDMMILKKIFTPDKVCDFSGVNKFTADFHNYYEQSHYRPHVAREILSQIYEKD